MLFVDLDDCVCYCYEDGMWYFINEGSLWV